LGSDALGEGLVFGVFLPEKGQLFLNVFEVH